MIRILKTAKALPKQCVTNDDLAKVMTTSDEWIATRTGIRQRFIANQETTSTLAATVIKRLLAATQLDPQELGLVIVATMSPDQLAPSVAARACRLAGVSEAMALDLNAACAGFVTALATAQGLLAQLTRSYAIVIGAETLSHLVDWQDRRTAVLFGDGAAGLLIQSTAEVDPNWSVDLKTWSENQDVLTAGGQTQHNLLTTSSPTYPWPFSMDGRQVYRFALNEVPASIQRALAPTPLTLADVDFVIVHQANQRILDRVSQALALPPDHFPSSIATYGNTSAASIPLMIHDLAIAQRLSKGQHLVLSGFGAGLNVASLVLTYHI